MSNLYYKLLNSDSINHTNIKENYCLLDINFTFIIYIIITIVISF